MSERVILVGRRRDNGRRDDLWAYAKGRWIGALDWPITTGYHETDEPFSLSRASNIAARAAADEKLGFRWDVALYVGADWIVADVAQARQACDLAEATRSLVFAHDETVVLSEAATDRILDGDPLESVWRTEGCSWHTNTFSGVMAIPRVLWDRVGGFDERLVGWGFDDLCFMEACMALGGTERVPGVLAHLWHPQVWEQREGSPTHGANMVLWERYKAARGDRTAMLALLAEPGGPLGAAGAGHS